MTDRTIPTPAQIRAVDKRVVEPWIAQLTSEGRSLLSTHDTYALATEIAYASANGEIVADERSHDDGAIKRLRTQIAEIDAVLEAHDPDGGEHESRAEQVAELAGGIRAAEDRANSAIAEREELADVVARIDLAMHADGDTKIRDVLAILAKFHEPKEIPF